MTIKFYRIYNASLLDTYHVWACNCDSLRRSCWFRLTNLINLPGMMDFPGNLASYDILSDRACWFWLSYTTIAFGKYSDLVPFFSISCLFLQHTFLTHTNMACVFEAFHIPHLPYPVIVYIGYNMLTPIDHCKYCGLPVDSRIIFYVDSSAN